MTLIRQLENRRKYEEREKKKHQVIKGVCNANFNRFLIRKYDLQMVLDKLISREKKITIKKRDAEILAELRKPQEDSELPNQKDLPELHRLPGLKLTGQALSDLLMVFEFLHNFGETLGFGELC